MNTYSRCPHCKEVNEVPLGTVGKAVSCQACRRVFVSIELDDAERAEVVRQANRKIPFSEAAEHYVVGGLEMSFVRIMPGNFTMGNAMGAVNERPEHQVTLQHPFYIAACLTTQAQYRELMEDSPSYFEGGDNPVECVSWYQALEFCRRLSERENVAKRLAEQAFFRLPTEAEWEYACRSGEEGAGRDSHSAGETVLMGERETKDALTACAWFLDNSGGSTHPVAQKQPSALGLCDMHGNVAEWCLDGYGIYPDEPQMDPQGWPEARRKVRRGGGWASTATRCRSTDRAGVLPDCRCALLGFRLVLVESGVCPYPRSCMVM